MLSVLVIGFLTGVALCFTFGTVFFSLVQNSVDNGYMSGVKMALGVVVCDAIFVFFAIYGTSLLPTIPHFELILSVLGVVFLTALGLINLVKGAPQIAYPKTRLGNFIYYFTTGFLLNGLNPVNFISWVTIATYLRATFNYTVEDCLYFFCSSLVAIFVTESLIAVFSHRLKALFTPKTVVRFNRVTGVVFLGIAAKITHTILEANF